MASSFDAGALKAARLMSLLVTFAAMRCASGWRYNLRGLTLAGWPTSGAPRAQASPRDRAAALSRHSRFPLQVATGRSSPAPRRRRGRLRVGFSGGVGVSGGVGGSSTRIHYWSLSPPSTALASDREAETAIRARSSEAGAAEALAEGVLVLAQGRGEELRRQQSRPNRRQRRRRRLRLQAFEDVEAELGGAVSMIESSVVGAGSLGVEPGIGPGFADEAAVGSVAAVGDAEGFVVGGRGGHQPPPLVDGGGRRGKVGGAFSRESDASGVSLSDPRSPSLDSGDVGSWGVAAGVVEAPPSVTRGRPRIAEEQGAKTIGGILRAEDDRFMRMALRLAERARMEGEVPIGAVLTETVATRSDGRRRVLSTGRNEVERRHDASAHAEMLCLQAAAKTRRNWRLAGATLYVTMEPCVMCLSAAQLFRVDRVVYGAPNPNLGACGGWVDLSARKHAFHELEVRGGVLAEECALPLRGFFRSRRREGDAAASAGNRPDIKVAVGGGAPEAVGKPVDG